MAERTLVERLRGLRTLACCREAADEIERQEQEIEWLRALVEPIEHVYEDDDTCCVRCGQDRVHCEPSGCAGDEGRLWCQDPDPVDCEDGVPWTEYVRADLANQTNQGENTDG